jgi:hypothetical protein
MDPTTASLASQVGRLVTTKSGLDSPRDARSPDADGYVDASSPPMLSTCLKKLDTLDSRISYTVKRSGGSDDGSSSSLLGLARLSAIRRPILPRPTNATFIADLPATVVPPEESASDEKGGVVRAYCRVVWRLHAKLSPVDNDGANLGLEFKQWPQKRRIVSIVVVSIVEVDQSLLVIHIVAVKIKYDSR